jgi:hypothetical protein
MLSMLLKWGHCRDEDAQGGMLATTSRVLADVHGAVFSALYAPPLRLPGGEVLQQNWDVRHALSELRQGVLRGVHIVFSRIIPLDTNPKLHPLWRLAEGFGAACSTRMGPETTHIVALSAGTDKVGGKRGICVCVVCVGGQLWRKTVCAAWQIWQLRLPCRHIPTNPLSTCAPPGAGDPRKSAGQVLCGTCMAGLLVRAVEASQGGALPSATVMRVDRERKVA